MAPAPGVSGVLAPNPATRAGGAYPLSLLTYAVTVPQSLDTPTRQDFARLVEYAIGPGQVQGTAFGQLPPGYAPLPSDLRQLALQVAKGVLSQSSKAPGGAGTGNASGGGSASRLPSVAAPLVSSAGLAAGNATTSVATTSSSGTAPTQPLAHASLARLRTPFTNAGVLRLLIVILLCVFGTAVVATLAGYGPSVRARLRRRGRPPRTNRSS